LLPRWPAELWLRAPGCSQPQISPSCDGIKEPLCGGGRSPGDKASESAAGPEIEYDRRQSFPEASEGRRAQDRILASLVLPNEIMLYADADAKFLMGFPYFCDW
jgi:hypothetical protein